MVKVQKNEISFAKRMAGASEFRLGGEYGPETHCTAACSGSSGDRSGSL
jgi:hypothetical protein